MVTLQLLGGRKEKIRPGDVLGALTGPDGGYTREQIGKINVTEFTTFVAVERDIAQEACTSSTAVASRVRASRYGSSSRTVDR
jgi:ATP-independent RNA helicase DbpA